jgi:gas vesicle protein
MATKKELTKFLNELSKEDLIKEFEKLYSKFKEVKQLYDLEISGDTSELLNKAKEAIENQFFPKRGFGNPKASELKKVIDDFAKVSIYPKDLIDLSIFRVEQAIAFTDAYGDIDMVFYNSTATAFERTLKLIVQHNYENEYKITCKELVDKTVDFGWGFHDDLTELYYEYLS